MSVDVDSGTIIVAGEDAAPLVPRHIEGSLTDVKKLQMVSGEILFYESIRKFVLSTHHGGHADQEVRQLSIDAKDVITSTTSVSDDATEQTLYTASIPADSLYVGQCFVVEARGVISNDSASDDITITTYMGATSLESFNPAIGNVSGASWKAKILMTVRSIGATGSIAFHGEIDIDGSEEIVDSIETIDTTVAEDITIKVTWDNAKATNQIDLYQAYLEPKK